MYLERYIECAEGAEYWKDWKSRYLPLSIPVCILNILHAVTMLVHFKHLSLLTHILSQYKNILTKTNKPIHAQNIIPKQRKHFETSILG